MQQLETVADSQGQMGRDRGAEVDGEGQRGRRAEVEGLRTVANGAEDSGKWGRGRGRGRGRCAEKIGLGRGAER
jgi:hypothetical protein